MIAGGCMNDDALLSIHRLNSFNTESVALEAFPSLGSTQLDVEFVGCEFSHGEQPWFIRFYPPCRKSCGWFSSCLGCR